MYPHKKRALSGARSTAHPRDSPHQKTGSSGWTQTSWAGSPSSADFTFVGNTAATSLAPLHNLQTDPATGHAIHGKCVITNNYSFEYHNTTAWQFVQAIGGQQRIGGEITIANN